MKRHRVTISLAPFSVETEIPEEVLLQVTREAEYEASRMGATLQGERKFVRQFGESLFVEWRWSE